MVEEESSEGEVGSNLPPDSLRCNRSDGKSWRCKHWRIHDRSLCERHYLDSKAKAKKKQGRRKGGVVYETRSKNVKPLKGVKVAYADPKSLYDESEEEEVIPQKKNRSVNANCYSGGNVKKALLSDRKGRLEWKRSREGFEEEKVVLRKKRKLENNLISRGGKNTHKDIVKKKEELRVEESEEEENEEAIPKKKSKVETKLINWIGKSVEKEHINKKKLKVEESEEEDEREEKKGDSQARIAERRARRGANRLIQAERDQEHEGIRTRGSKSRLVDGRSNAKFSTASKASLVSLAPKRNF